MKQWKKPVIQTVSGARLNELIRVRACSQGFYCEGGHAR